MNHTQMLNAIAVECHRIMHDGKAKSMAYIAALAMCRQACLTLRSYW
jgi:hypothetical protein